MKFQNQQWWSGLRASAYYCFEQLTDDIKKRNGIKVGAKVPRFDCTKAVGYYPPMDALKNKKGQLFTYLSLTNGIINSPDERRADRFLQAKDSFNLSSIFILGRGLVDGLGIVGYGNPNGSRAFGKGNATNPFFEYRDDGFLFLASPDWQTIEMIVLPKSKYTIIGNAKELADGVYNDALELLRENARPIFSYI